MPYYVIEQSYAGPNPDQHLDDHTLRVQTVPGRGNMSKQPILNGWLGCTNDWDETAHGEFETLDEAKTAIDNITDGDYREDELDRYQDDGIVYRVRAGLLQPWTAADSCDWCYESMRDTVGTYTPNDEIESWAMECAYDAKAEGGLLDTDAVYRMAMKYRNDLAALTEY